MIIVDDADRLRVITQPDHARFAAELLALWRSDGLPEHPRRDDLLLATREHDNGWQEADSAPRIDPQARRPFDFRSYPGEARLEIWRRGIHRFADQRPLVALLIAEHAETLHQPLDRRWQEFFAELEPYRQNWLDEAAVDRFLVRQDYLYLELADALSLAICTGSQATLESRGLRARVEGDLLRLDPFPLAGTTSFRIPCRQVANRPYDSDTQIGRALARARWQHWHIRVGPDSRAAA